MHRVRPCSIDERMDECEAEQYEQNNPADPRERHEGGEDTTWRILMAPTQVPPKSLCTFIITSASGYGSLKRWRRPAHGRDSGTNEPHHPKHGERNTLYPERVNHQTVVPHVNRVNAKEQVLLAHTPHAAAYSTAVL